MKIGLSRWLRDGVNLLRTYTVYCMPVGTGCVNAGPGGYISTLPVAIVARGWVPVGGPWEARGCYRIAAS